MVCKGLLVQRLLGGDLTHISQEHDADPVGDKVDDRQVVTDEQVGKMVLLLQILQ